MTRPADYVISCEIRNGTGHVYMRMNKQLCNRHNKKKIKACKHGVGGKTSTLLVEW